MYARTARKPRSSPVRRSSARKAPETPTPLGKGRWHSSTSGALAGGRNYYVYVPFGLRKTTRAPLVMALHGCGQGAMAFARTTRLHQLADRHKFIVVYPEQTPMRNTQQCWNWQMSSNQSRGQGEPSVLAGIARRLIGDRTHWRIDPGRVYVMGFSAGATMAVTMGATYPDLFAAVGAHSGPPYEAATGTAQAIAAMQGQIAPPPPSSKTLGPLPPTIIFQGSLDATVRATNGPRVANQWIDYFEHDPGHLPLTGPRVTRKERAQPIRPTSARGYTVQRWSVSRLRTLELWSIDGLGHAWSGGAPKSSYSDPRGPRASSEMWRFFSAHRIVF